MLGYRSIDIVVIPFVLVFPEFLYVSMQAYGEFRIFAQIVLGPKNVSRADVHGGRPITINE